MSEVKVNKISPRSGTAITLGDSGDTFTIPSGATLAIAGSVTGFTSAGIDDNATSVAITIDSSERVGIGNTSPTGALDVKSSTQPQLKIGTASATADRNAGFLVTASNSATPGARSVVVSLDADGGDGSGTDNLTITKTGGDGDATITNQNNAGLVFGTNNAEGMRLTTTGLGIGTSTPTTTLDVDLSGTGETVPIVLSNRNTTAGTGQKTTLGFGLARNSGAFKSQAGTIEVGREQDWTSADTNIDSYMAFSTYLNNAGTEKLRITSAGLVGIGETAPLGQLHVKSADSGASVNSGHNQVIAENSGNSGFSILSGNTSNGAICFGDDGNNCKGYVNYTHNGDHLDFGVNGAEKMRVSSDGDVGIGISSPAHRLSVFDGSTGIVARFATTGNRSLDISSADNGAYAGAHWNRDVNSAGGMHTWSIEGNERMRIDSAGRLLVGTTSPYSNNNAISIALNSTNSTSSPFPQGIVYRKLNFQGSNAVAVDFQDFAGNREGSIQFNESGTSFNTSSDYRLKENIVEITDATSRLKQLKPKRFNFIADADTTVDGFIAHEVSNIVPEAITGTKDAVDENGKAIYQGIDQSKLVPLLVKTIQELEARITTLEANNP